MRSSRRLRLFMRRMLRAWERGRLRFFGNSGTSRGWRGARLVFGVSADLDDEVFCWRVACVDEPVDCAARRRRHLPGPAFPACRRARRTSSLAGSRMSSECWITWSGNGRCACWLSDSWRPTDFACGEGEARGRCGSRCRLGICVRASGRRRRPSMASRGCCGRVRQVDCAEMRGYTTMLSGGVLLSGMGRFEASYSFIFRFAGFQTLYTERVTSCS